MTEKFEFYDILGILVPGVLMLSVVVMCFPAVAQFGAAAKFPEPFSVLVLTALAVFLGHLLQAVSSFVEPALEWTWGGKPSERALVRGLGARYLPADTGKRIRAELSINTEPAASSRSLFLLALQIAETSSNTRVGKFNGLYAYHRGLLVLILVAEILFCASTKWGAMRTWNSGDRTVVLAVGATLIFLAWFRARQRSFYYVREVLLTAERTLRTKPGGERAV